MEDNEFEEVTIISHTDQGATILPQRTAERLMKDIRLEVTQKISPTENIKYGSDQNSAASTELHQLIENNFANSPNLEFGFFSKISTKPTSYVIGSNVSALLSNGSVTSVVPSGAKVSTILRWQQYLAVFPEYG